jgi:hypothetical protein
MNNEHIFTQPAFSLASLKTELSISVSTLANRFNSCRDKGYLFGYKPTQAFLDYARENGWLPEAK